MNYNSKVCRCWYCPNQIHNCGNISEVLLLHSYVMIAPANEHLNNDKYCRVGQLLSLLLALDKRKYISEVK